jgi:predicted CoA-binding protein
VITQPSHQELSTLLAECKSVAVIGASPNPHRASNWISKFLMDQNYNVIPVNPGHSQLFGVKCYPDLISIQEEVDIVNIYRRSEAVLPIIEDAIQRDDIKLIWMQDNVYNPEAAELATEKGIPTIMNDCIYRFLMR